MTNRQTAMTYGVLVACAAAIALLILEPPSGRNLVVAIIAGIAFGIGSWVYLERH